MNKVKVQCPQCGSILEVSEVPAHIATVCTTETTQTTINLKDMKAEAKIEALRKAGVDTSNLFAIRGISGDNVVGRFEDGKFEALLDSDPIFKAIRASRTIPDRRLFRRWVMAQVFHMLTATEWGKKTPMGFTKALQNKGYRYQWEMVIEELRVQSKLYGKDPENFAERNRWFNKDVIVSMAEDYITLVKRAIKKLPIRKCKKVPYIRLFGVNVFVEDVPNKIYAPLNKALGIIKQSTSPETLQRATFGFFEHVKKTYLRYNLLQSRAFKDAYKGAGAFYTLKNLILFHDCVFQNMNQEASIAYLNYLVKPKDFEGYKLFGILKEFLTNNHIDIAAKQAEWRTNKVL